MAKQPAPFKPQTRQASIQGNMVLRARIIQAVRHYFIDHAFLEVETPVRIPAPIPEAHIDAPASGSWFLQPSPELYMKMLLASDYPRIFQICKCFRQNERGDRHIPEMTLLEWYCPGDTYMEVMDQCEDLIRSVAPAAGFNDIIPFQTHKIELKKPWDRMSVAEVFEKFVLNQFINKLQTTSAMADVA